MLIMRDITVKQVIEDLRFGLSDILRMISRGEYDRLFGRPEHHLSTGVLMLTIAIMISMMRM